MVLESFWRSWVALLTDLLYRLKRNICSFWRRYEWDRLEKFSSRQTPLEFSLHSLLILLFLFSSSLLLISFHLNSSSRLLLPSSLDISSSLILFHLTFFSSLLISSHLLLVSSNLISPSSRLNQGSTTVTQAAQCSCVSPTAIVLHISIR